MISVETRGQIETLALDREKPLIICDVDEVVLHFLRGLEAHLKENGMWLDPASFALNGNVKYAGTNDPLPASEIGPILHAFFEARAGNLDVIDNAAETLNELGEMAEVVLLTNMPHAFRKARVENLQSHSIHHPVISNSGMKGPAVREISAGTKAPVIFLDDTPNNLHSVADTCPETTIIHFIQDDRFGRYLDVIERFSYRTNNWIETGDHIRGKIGDR
ncbi:MAG: hypothetical protein ACR2OR_05345 [Hyphomicrobiales bacterium]